MACTLFTLEPETAYWVALVNYDNAGNASPISTAGGSLKTYPSPPPGASAKKKGFCSTGGEGGASIPGLLAVLALASTRRRAACGP